MVCAGVRISPGTYHVSPNIEEQVHLNMRCGQGARDGGGFEVDFTGVFLYFTVWPWHINQCTHPSVPCLLL